MFERSPLLAFKVKHTVEASLKIMLRGIFQKVKTFPDQQTLLNSLICNLYVEQDKLSCENFNIGSSKQIDDQSQIKFIQKSGEFPYLQISFEHLISPAFLAMFTVMNDGYSKTTYNRSGKPVTVTASAFTLGLPYSQVNQNIIDLNLDIDGEIQTFKAFCDFENNQVIVVSEYIDKLWLQMLEIKNLYGFMYEYDDQHEDR